MKPNVCVRVEACLLLSHFISRTKTTVEMTTKNTERIEVMKKAQNRKATTDENCHNIYLYKISIYQQEIENDFASNPISQ